MLTKLQTGPITGTDGNPATARGSKDGALVIAGYRGKYAEAAYRGKIFTAANQAAVTTTVGLATTYTGLCLSNPINSVVNLELIIVSVMQSVLQATQVEAFALATGSSGTAVTHTTPGTVKPALVGSAFTGVGLVDTAATLPVAPVYDTFLTNTATATQDAPGVTIDLNGSIILAPGAYVCFVTPAQASVAGMWFGIKWAEIAI